MVSTRGHAQEYHKIPVQNDYDVALKANALVEEVLLKDRLIDRKTKELIFIVGLTQHGMLAWQEITGAPRIEPTVDALEAFKAKFQNEFRKK